MRVQAFCLLEEEFSAENGLLTQTLKMKRPVIAQHYGEAIEAILDRS